VLTVIPAFKDEASVDPRDAVGWFVEIGSKISRGTRRYMGICHPLFRRSRRARSGWIILEERSFESSMVQGVCVQPVVENLR
jgi:hypothetical protein